MKKILILGGGFGGLELYRQLHKLCHSCEKNGVEIELISRDNYLTFTPMLHEAATGSVSREHVVQPIRDLMACCENSFYQEEILGIDLRNKQVTTDRQAHECDIMAVALGVRQGFYGVPGASEFAYPLKTLRDAINVRNKIIASFEEAGDDVNDGHADKLAKKLSFVIVGGGETGVELAGQLADLMEGDMKWLYPKIPNDLVKITIIHRDDRLLSMLPEKASEMAQRRLEEMGVQLLLGKTVKEVFTDGVSFNSGEKFLSENVFWTAGTEANLPGLVDRSFLNERGLLVTNEFRQVAGLEGVYGLGDAAVVDGEKFSTPPTAQAVVWEAKLVARSIVNSLHGRASKVKPYRSKGDIVPIGDWYAVFIRGRLVFGGKLAWVLRRVAFLRAMYGLGDKLRVIADWTIDVFLPRDTSKF